GLHRLAERDLDFGVHASDAFHVLALDLRRTRFAGDGEHVLRRDDLTGRRADQHVADVGDFLAIRLTEAHDNRVLIAALAELRGRGAGDVRLDGRRDALYRHPEHCCLRTVDANRDLRTTVLAAQTDVREPGDVFHHVP